MEENINTLIEDFTCDDVIKCQTARRKLVKMGNDAVEPLVKALSSKRHWVRWEAAKALGQIGDKAATEALVNALEDNEFDVRWLAAEALINIGRGSIKPLLVALADHGDKSLSLRRGAHHVLHDIDRSGLNTILHPVMSAVEDSSPSITVLQIAEKALDSLNKQ
jgi:HEAT repeat protein